LTGKPWTDRKVEIIIGNLLRAGVMISAFVVLLGGVVYLARYGSSPADYRIFRGESADLRYVKEIVVRAASFSGRGIIQFGLLLLIATPVARVVFSIIGFLEEGDYMYVVFASIVLSVLLYSLIGSAY